MLTIPILIILGILFFISAFFSASEIALIGLSKIRLRHLVEKGVKNALIIQRLITKLDRLIAAILIGNNFVNIAISVIVTAISIYLFGPRLGIIISAFLASFFVLIFCEMTPKIFAFKNTEKFALLSAPIMELLIILFAPLIKIFTLVSNFVLRVFGGTPLKRSPLITEEELRLMIEMGKEEGVLTDDERKMLHRIFEFGDTKVSDVMVLKDKIVAIDIKASPDGLLNLLVEEGHARIPVYEGSIDKIIGMIYANDLLHIWRNKELIVLSDLVRTVFYCSPTKRVNELLRDFQTRRIQISIVVDENKKTLGLVTLEDLLEEIVGEIEQELIDRKDSI